MKGNSFQGARAMNEEEKGFVIKDKRSLDEKGELKKEGLKEAIKGEEKKESREEEPQKIPLPEVSLSSLIFSLSSSALLHLGEITDPQTGEKKEDLALAKHSIDTIGMLKEKTRGNLTEEEDKFIESILTDLRWRYVKAKK